MFSQRIDTISMYNADEVAIDAARQYYYGKNAHFPYTSVTDVTNIDNIKIVYEVVDRY